MPLALLAKRPLVHFDLRNEEQHSIPLLTAEQHRTIARELLYRQLDSDLADQDAEPVALAAGELIEAVLADEPQDLDDRIRALEDEHGVDLADFRGSAAVLSRNFILWAVVRGLERRRVFKFAFDEPLGRSPNFIFFIGAPGCTEALSYHLEVAVPGEVKARSTRLLDAATDTVLSEGERDADRPSLYFASDPARLPARPEVAIAFGAERGRFLGPAAVVATVIALLVGPPFLFADLQALAGSAGPAIGLVLSTSAVFSALVLRTDEHPLLRLMLVPARLLLVASTLAALFAAAALGFRAEAWILETTWALAALVAALSAGILIVEAARAPSGRRGPAPEPP